MGVRRHGRDRGNRQVVHGARRSEAGQRPRRWTGRATWFAARPGHTCLRPTRRGL